MSVLYQSVFGRLCAASSRWLSAALDSRRRRLGLLALCCALGMLFALALEYIWGLEPCPLCYLQRVALVLAGLSFGVGWWLYPRWHGAWTWFGALWALSGVGISARHLWLQSLPKEYVPPCLPDMAYLVDVLPIGELIVRLLADGHCAEVLGRFLGLSIPAWTLVLFGLLLVLAIVQALNKGERLWRT